MGFIHILDSSSECLRNQETVAFQIGRIGREVIFSAPASSGNDDPDIRTLGTDCQDILYGDCPVFHRYLTLQPLLYISQSNGSDGMSDGYTSRNCAAKRTDDGLIKGKLILQSN